MVLTNHVSTPHTELHAVIHSVQCIEKHAHSIEWHAFKGFLNCIVHSLCTIDLTNS